jgi:hypothetical protein
MPSSNMNIYKQLFLLFPLFTVSCKNPIDKPKQVWLYKVEGAEVLNGDVKILSIGDSLSKDNCFIAHFDKEGNMATSFERLVMVSSHNNVMDTTTVSAKKTDYTFTYNSDGRKLALVGHTSSNHGNYTSQWNFDRNGYLVNCVPNIEDTSFSTVKYRHDKAGNIIAYDRFFFPGKKNRHITPDLFRYKYDNDNRVTEEILLDRIKDSVMISVKSDYQFVSFDQHNNWVKETVHWNNYIPVERDSASWTQTRKIAYY